MFLIKFVSQNEFCFFIFDRNFSYDGPFQGWEKKIVMLDFSIV